MHTEANSEKTIRRVRVERGIYQDPRTSRFEITYMDSTGRQRWKTVAADGIKAARKARADVVRLDRDERVTPKTTTIAEIAETWYELKKPKLRTRTADYYRTGLDLVVLPRFGRLKVASVDADAIAKLIRDLEGEGLHAIDADRAVHPLGRSSIENYLKPLQGSLSLAVRRGIIPSNPFTVLTEDDRPERPDKKPPHEWTDDELAALLEASTRLAEKKESRYDYTPLLRLVAALGLRKGEALGLTWDSFDKDASVLHVRRQWLCSGEYGPTKTPAGVRRIALPPDLRDELIALRLRSRFSRDEEPMFASLTGTPLGHRNVLRRGWEPAREAAKLPSCLTLHDLRHAAASRLINAGLDPVTVAAVLGHEDATVTLKVYGHLWDRSRTDDEVRRALTGGGR